MRAGKADRRRPAGTRRAFFPFPFLPPFSFSLGLHDTPYVEQGRGEIFLYVSSLFFSRLFRLSKAACSAYLHSTANLNLVGIPVQRSFTGWR